MIRWASCCDKADGWDGLSLGIRAVVFCRVLMLVLLRPRMKWVRPIAARCKAVRCLEGGCDWLGPLA